MGRKEEFAEEDEEEREERTERRGQEGARWSDSRIRGVIRDEERTGRGRMEYCTKGG